MTDMESDEERLREIAHRIWEQEGCPEGQHDRHWAMAQEALAAEKSQTESAGGKGLGTAPTAASDI